MEAGLHVGLLGSQIWGEHISPSAAHLTPDGGLRLFTCPQHDTLVPLDVRLQLKSASSPKRTDYLIAPFHTSFKAFLVLSFV